MLLCGSAVSPPVSLFSLVCFHSFVLWLPLSASLQHLPTLRPCPSCFLRILAVPSALQRVSVLVHDRACFSLLPVPNIRATRTTPSARAAICVPTPVSAAATTASAIAFVFVANRSCSPLCPVLWPAVVSRGCARSLAWCGVSCALLAAASLSFAHRLPNVYCRCSLTWFGSLPLSIRRVTNSEMAAKLQSHAINGPTYQDEARPCLLLACRLLRCCCPCV